MRRLLVLLVLATAAFATAQRSPTGTTNRLMLTMMPDVKKELKISKDQDKKIQEAVKTMQEQAEAGQIRIDFTDPMASMDVDFTTILDDAQKARLEELFVQYNGGFALADPKVVTALGLSEDVVAQVKSIKGAASRELLQVMSQARSTSAVKAADKKREEFSLQMLALLTDEQKAKFETMKGKAFKFKA